MSKDIPLRLPYVSCMVDSALVAHELCSTLARELFKGIIASSYVFDYSFSPLIYNLQVMDNRISRKPS